MNDPLAAFVDAACVPLDRGHATGTLERAELILAGHPELAQSSIYAMAILGDANGIRDIVSRDPAVVNATGGPRDWDALTHLCFSRYLRLDRSRSEAFVQSAGVLLDAGANPNTGWYENSHQPAAVWESALYGAAGVAHNAALTRLLLERGADPNDEETPYHTPEGYDNRALQVIVESGKLSDDNLNMMLLRKADWHDLDGIRWLLAHGADSNRINRWSSTAFHHAILRDNDRAIIEAFLDAGADAVSSVTERHGDATNQTSAFAIAARRGRGDVLELFEQRGIALDLSGVDGLMAACARNDLAQIESILRDAPQLVNELVARAGRILCEFAGNGNRDGVLRLLDLGIDVDAVHGAGDGYWEVTAGSTALHVAAWRARHEVVKVLIEGGATIDARDGAGRTPLALAVKACVDSYWTGRRSPDSVRALLDAGASPRIAGFPSGYEAVDDLLRRYGTGVV